MTRWRPFFLNPDTPPAGEPYLPFLIAKFGSRERVEAIFAQVRAAGAAYGIDYHFEKIAVRANTFDAHRLIHRAQQRGDARPLVERLFAAQFQRGENVGERALLVGIAAECGDDPAAVAAYLASAEDVEAVRAEEIAWRRRGVRVVPTFVVDRRWLVPGAEDPATLAAAIRRARLGQPPG